MPLVVAQGPAAHLTRIPANLVQRVHPPSLRRVVGTGGGPFRGLDQRADSMWPLTTASCQRDRRAMERTSQGSVREILLRAVRRRAEAAALIVIPALLLAQWALVRTLHVVVGPAVWALYGGAAVLAWAVLSSIGSGRAAATAIVGPVAVGVAAAIVLALAGSAVAPSSWPARSRGWSYAKPHRTGCGLPGRWSFSGGRALRLSTRWPWVATRGPSGPMCSEAWQTYRTAPP